MFDHIVGWKTILEFIAALLTTVVALLTLLGQYKRYRAGGNGLEPSDVSDRTRRAQSGHQPPTFLSVVAFSIKFFGMAFILLPVVLLILHEVVGSLLSRQFGIPRGNRIESFLIIDFLFVWTLHLWVTLETSILTATCEPKPWLQINYIIGILFGMSSPLVIAALLKLASIPVVSAHLITKWGL